jgi:hypothetical protein
MIYEVHYNKGGFSDYVIREDGTIVSNNGPVRPVLVTHINVIGGTATPKQSFSLFALIMQLQKELTRPLVVGDISWDEIVAGAK